MGISTHKNCERRIEFFTAHATNFTKVGPRRFAVAFFMLFAEVPELRSSCGKVVLCQRVLRCRKNKPNLLFMKPLIQCSAQLEHLEY